MTHHINPDTITLESGGHASYEDGTCLLEAVAWWAGRRHTDHPECVSPVLGAYGRALNDSLSQEKRQELRPFIRLLPGTAGDGQDETRSYLALDWLIRTYTPAWLDLAGLTAEATALRDLWRIAGLVAARAAGPVVEDARTKAAAAWAAARDAAGDAAWAAAGAAAGDAAWAAAGAAAGDAAWAAAWDAAGDAAWAAAGAAAWDAAGAAAWAAAGAAAWDAAWAAAWDAAGAAAWDAAWAAARAVLQPTVDQLQDSAIALFTALVNPAEVTT